MHITVIISQVIGSLTFIPWFIASRLSFMVFDTPKATKNFFPWLVILLIFSYPFVVSASYWRAWSNVFMGDYVFGFLWTAFPIAIFIIGYFIIALNTDLFGKRKK